MKRILIPAILAVTILVGAVLAYAIWKAEPQTAQDYYNSGKKYFDQGQYKEAVIQFSNSVQKEPKLRDAHFYLAQSYLKQRNLNEAGKELVNLLEYYPDDVEANILLGNIMLTSGAANPKLFEQAKVLAEKVLKRDPKVDDKQLAAAWILSGNAAAGLQDYRSSVDMFEKAVALEPKNAATFVSLGSSQALQKNFGEAEKAFLKAVEVDPKGKAALISLGNFYQAIGKTDLAEAAFKNALSAYPAEREIYGPVVLFYYQIGRFDDAEKVLLNAQSLLDAQSNPPKNPAPSLILYSLYVSRNRAADGRKLLVDLKTKFPDDLEVAAALALNFMPDLTDQAKSEIDRILTKDPKNADGLLLRAQLQFSKGDYDGSVATLGMYPQSTNPFPQSQFLLGQIAIKKGKLDEAQQHFQESLKVNGAYLPARVALAEVLMDKGNLADSRVEVRKILDVNPGFFPALLVKATLDTAEKNWAQAEPVLESLSKAQPNNALVQRQFGFLHQAQGKNADAEKNFSRAVELLPDSKSSFQDLIQFYMRTKQPDRAIQRISSVPDDKKQGFHYELLGLVYAQAGKTQDAENAYKKALEKDPSNSSSVGYLATLYIQGNRYDEGLKALDVVISKNPSNAGAYAIKGMIHETQGKLDDARQDYSQAIKIDPNSEVAGNNLAFLLADSGQDLNTALGLAQAARKRQSDNPNIADTLGWVYYKLGNYLLARDQLLFAVGKQPANLEFQYHLGMIYKGNKQNPEAQAALKKALAGAKDFKGKSDAQAALKELSASK